MLVAYAVLCHGVEVEFEGVMKFDMVVDPLWLPGLVLPGWRWAYYHCCCIYSFAAGFTLLL